jgi:hypothetical protein
MRDQLILAAVVFLLLVITLAPILVHWSPRSQIFWKRADYMYFGFAVAGVALGITESTRNYLRLEVESAFARRTELHRGLFVEIYTAQKQCEGYESAKEGERQQEIDTRFGIIRPLEDLEYKGEKPFEFAPWYITDRDCDILGELYELMIRFQAPAAQKLAFNLDKMVFDASADVLHEFWDKTSYDQDSYDG